MTWGLRSRRWIRAALAITTIVAATTSTSVSAAGASNGARVWVSRYDGPRHKNDYAVAVVASPDGETVFVAGTSYYGPGTSACSAFATVAYDAGDGSQRWTARWEEGSPYTCNDVVGAATSGDGARLFVTGTSFTGGATVAYDTVDGTELWVARPAEPLSPVGVVATTSADTVYVAGSLSANDCPVDPDPEPLPCNHIAAIAYDAATGTPRWFARYDGFEGNSWATAIAASPDGTSVYVTGSGSETVAFDASTGSVQWVAHAPSVYLGPVVVSADGETVYVAGSDDRHALIAYDAIDGSELWIKHLGAAFSNSRIAVSPNADVVFFAAGAEGRITNVIEDYTVTAIDGADGHTVWRLRYGRARYDEQARAVAVSPDGAQVVVAGAGARQPRCICSYSYRTVVFDAADGTQRWVGRYGGGLRGDDLATAVAVGPLGEIFVTGDSEAEDTWQDFATVKYAPTSSPS